MQPCQLHVGVSHPRGGDGHIVAGSPRAGRVANGTLGLWLWNPLSHWPKEPQCPCLCQDEAHRLLSCWYRSPRYILSTIPSAVGLGSGQPESRCHKPQRGQAVGSSGQGTAQPQGAGRDSNGSPVHSDHVMQGPSTRPRWEMGHEGQLGTGAMWATPKQPLNKKQLSHAASSRAWPRAEVG